MHFIHQRILTNDNFNNLIYIVQLDTSGILTSLYIVTKYIQHMFLS